jgi:3-hydroxyisobutyrate dehydrogenase-like beta-hydroxyacid dehydrogenase
MGTATLGFIGLGVMGGRMCRNLATKSRCPVIAFDLDPDRAALLADVGVQAASSIREVVNAADVIFLCLPGEPQVRAVCLDEGGVVDSVRSGQTIVDMTTATVGVAREVAAALAAKGVAFADAPVARGVPSAEDGTLSITVGGSEDVLHDIEPYLRCMGTDISHCGPVGTGQVMKLMNNMLVFETVSALAEAMAIATRAGVDRSQVFEILQRGSADSFVMRRHGSHMTTGEYPDNVFPTRYSVKDIGYALALADSLGVDAAGARLAEARLQAVMDRGWGDLYSPVVYRLFED